MAYPNHKTVDVMNGPVRPIRFEDMPLRASVLADRRFLQRETALMPVKSTLRIAILRDSTIETLLDLISTFLRMKGIQVCFWVGDFDRVVEDALFRIDEIKGFAPDLVLIHWLPHPVPTNKPLQVFMDECVKMWDALSVLHCNIFQTNVPYAEQEVMHMIGVGSFDECSSSSINNWLMIQAQKRVDLEILDINYLSAKVGLNQWYDNRMRALYGYEYSPKMIPFIAFSFCRRILAVFGHTHKALILDLDNTLWGGVWAESNGDVLLGGESAQGRLYAEVQRYVLALQRHGIMLAICSKNDYENIRNCFDHPST